MEFTHIKISNIPSNILDEDTFSAHQNEADRQAQIARSAPELLAALQDIIDNGLSTSKINKARAAITKALGENNGNT